MLSPRKTRRNTPKNCQETACGNTCIDTPKQCRIDDPKITKSISQKTTVLASKLKYPNLDKDIRQQIEKAESSGNKRMLKNLKNQLINIETKIQDRFLGIGGITVPEKYRRKGIAEAATQTMREMAIERKVPFRFEVYAPSMIKLANKIGLVPSSENQIWIDPKNPYNKKYMVNNPHNPYEYDIKEKLEKTYGVTLPTLDQINKWEDFQ